MILMILKKEQISEERINCYLSLNSKISKVTIGNKTFEMDLSSIKEIESSDKYDIVTNYLLRINKLLSNLKNKDENFINSNINIFVDNKMVEKIIKPEGFIIAKPSKEFKKSVDNVRLKAMLGITLQELSNFKNIDLIFENFLLKEESNMDNNTFKHSNEDNNFDLNMDISGLNDMINVSDVDSLNYDEDDLFKEFDLNAENLFVEKNTDNFVFEDENISIPEYSIESNEDKLDTFKVEEEENFEFIYSEDSFLENSNTESVANEETLHITDEPLTIDDTFVFETKDEIESINNDFILSVDDNSKSNPSFTESESEDFVYSSSTEEIYKPVDTDSEILTFTENTEEIYKSVDTDSETLTFTENIEEFISSNDILYTDNKEITEDKSSNINETEILPKATNIEEDIKIYDTIEVKEDTTMDKNNIKNNKTLDINDKFIQNELMELKNLLESKSNSYKHRFAELNAKYEEKHLALKDLNLTDEAQQLKVFKEFLSCKSTMISLKELDNTYKDIISDIEKRISNIKK